MDSSPLCASFNQLFHSLLDLPNDYFGLCLGKVCAMLSCPLALALLVWIFCFLGGKCIMADVELYICYGCNMLLLLVCVVGFSVFLHLVFMCWILYLNIWNGCNILLLLICVLCFGVFSFYSPCLHVFIFLKCKMWFCYRVIISLLWKCSLRANCNNPKLSTSFGGKWKFKVISDIPTYYVFMDTFMIRYTSCLWICPCVLLKTSLLLLFTFSVK